MLIPRVLLVFTMILTIGGLHTSVVSTPVPYSCPVTSADDIRPDHSLDPFDDNASVYYADGLWVSIPKDGVIELSIDDVISFGPLTGWRSETITWLREDGVEGFVEVTGRRLDAHSDLTPQTPLSPQRQYVRVGTVTTGLAFPSEGCWEVTGSVSDRKITFVVEVQFTLEPAATPDA